MLPGFRNSGARRKAVHGKTFDNPGILKGPEGWFKFRESVSQRMFNTYVPNHHPRDPTPIWVYSRAI